MIKAISNSVANQLLLEVCRLAATTLDGSPDSGWCDSRILLLASSEKGVDHHCGPVGHRRQNQWSEYHLWDNLWRWLEFVLSLR